MAIPLLQYNRLVEWAPPPHDPTPQWIIFKFLLIYVIL